MKLIKIYSSFLVRQFSKITSLPSEVNRLNGLQRLWLLITILATPLILITLYLFIGEQIAPYLFFSREFDAEDLFLEISFLLTCLLSPAILYWFFDYLIQIFKWLLGETNISFRVTRSHLINTLLVLAIIALIILIIVWVF